MVSFTIDEPFDVAFKLLRKALEREGLRIAAEVDTSGRLRSELGVGLRDSVVLYVDAPILLLEATVFTIAGSLYIPEPVVLSGSRKTSVAAVRSIEPLLDESLPVSVRRAVLSLHERILKAIQTIGSRESVLQYQAEAAAALT